MRFQLTSDGTDLLDQIRERICFKHYSLRTELAYVHWVRVFVK